ncbi:uncharacterized protein LOC124271693 [Haliotis rubra]|uniref:uncharacterized protein LOC124271693 n=1 Tax=Haliotis rubra TaxID=36100 RepID=UPI001EE5056A|nr:uncharacterized protein LOC124271693 [Haliotis rubra]
MKCTALLAVVAISCFLTQAEGASVPGVLKKEKTVREAQDELQDQLLQLIDAVNTAEGEVDGPDNRRDVEWPWETPCAPVMANCSFSGPYCCGDMTCFRRGLQWSGECRVVIEEGTVPPLRGTD